MSVSSVVGIDVAKAHVDVFVLGAEFKAQRFDNEAEGHSALAAALAPLGARLVVMEATGGYEAALACSLGRGLCRRSRQPQASARLRQRHGLPGQD